MFRVGRQPQFVEHPTPTGAVIRLHEETWWVLLAHRWGGGVFTYRRPRLVESDGLQIRIHDIVGIARFTALAAMLAVTFLRRLK
ncbi:MAG TPA: hypothetical protein VE569_11360 [Acidimicrobiia bacterium]|jgi:hypothetical protein|nr:hypothetical protein [Acidimicrobiia bacterium]